MITDHLHQLRKGFTQIISYISSEIEVQEKYTYALNTLDGIDVKKITHH